MDIKNLVSELKAMIEDVKKKPLSYNASSVVPSITDVELTYESGKEKKGKLIKTCVLFVDIRNSVELTKKHQHETMGCIYTAFTKAVLSIAKEHNASVRNIIGDRVMVVFPENNCFTNAIDCAITINHAATIIRDVFANVNFHCGIGIDYGDMRVLKVGIERKGDENQENKNLVWIGEPANLASRLTDVANKEFKDVKYTIMGEFYHYDPLGLSASLFFTPQTGWIKETKEMTPEEVANSLSFSQDGKLTFSGRNISAFKKEEIVYKYKPILLSEEVYTNYKKEHSQRVDIQKKMWIKESRKIKDISYNVWGADLHWSIS